LDTGQDNGTLRVTIREAAARLGVTESAIRKRIQRGSLDKEMGGDGRVYVYLELSQDTSHSESQLDGGPLVEMLSDQVAYLRAQLDQERDARRRADTIIAQLTQATAALAQRVPELESRGRGEPPGGSESVFDEPESAEPRPGTGGAQEAEERVERSWWRRVFG
jgi:hypothetical protein